MQEKDTVLAGSYGEGIFRSADGGQTWASANEGLTATALRTIIADPTQDGAIICGTEPGRGYRSADGGQTWREMEGIAAVPGISNWYLPYSPRAGALRNFYSPPGDSGRLLASIEVGGLLDSPDGGQTWTMADTFDDDIHHITGHPENPDVLWMALGWAGLKHRPQVNRPALWRPGPVRRRRAHLDQTDRKGLHPRRHRAPKSAGHGTGRPCAEGGSTGADRGLLRQRGDLGTGRRRD